MTCFLKILIKVAPCVHLFLFFINSPLSGQPDKMFSGTAEHAYFSLFNLNTEPAEALYRQNDDKPEYWYLKNLSTTIDILVKEDKGAYTKAKYVEDELLDKVNDLDDEDPIKLFLKAEIKLQWAILKIRFGDQFAAFWNLRQAYIAATDNIQKFPDHAPSQKTVGLLNVVFGSVPDSYSWLLGIFGINGDVSEGMEALEKIYRQNGLFSLESGIIIAILKTYLLEQQDDSEKIMGEVYDTHEKYLINTLAYSLILMKNTKGSKALKLLQSQPGENFNKIPQLHYIFGELLLQKGAYQAAINRYDRYLKSYNGEYMVKDAYYKTGLCYVQSDNIDMARTFFKKAQEISDSDSEADKYAQAVISSGVIPNKALTMARYAIDGGFFDIADSVLNTISLQDISDREKTEYYYRKGRMYHWKKDLDKAIFYYKETIVSQKQPDWYYAPNACLLLAKISYLNGDTENVKHYLKKLKDYKKYPYQKSIERKAKYLSRESDK